MNKYKLTFYSYKKNCDEEIYFEKEQDFKNLKNCLLNLVYIKDLVAFKFDTKSKEYKEIRL